MLHYAVVIKFPAYGHNSVSVGVIFEVNWSKWTFFMGEQSLFELIVYTIVLYNEGIFIIVIVEPVVVTNLSIHPVHLPI